MAGGDPGGADSGTIFKVLRNGLLHYRRDFAFVTCTVPIRKLEITWPEPAEVYLRQLNVTNVDTGLTHIHEFEDKEMMGWAFPVVSNSRIEVRPNLIGLDLEQAEVRYGWGGAMVRDKQDAERKLNTFPTEWIQFRAASWYIMNHYKVWTPALVLHRNWGGSPVDEKLIEPMYAGVDDTKLSNPAVLQSMSHGMMDSRLWSITYKFPNSGDKMDNSPNSFQLKAMKCPDEGCLGGFVALNWTWNNPVEWSAHFGPTALIVEGEALEIKPEEWIVFNMVETISIKNLTIYGKLSFLDGADRVLETDHIIVWGMLEIGTESNPFGAVSGKTARVRLRGAATDVDSYVYMEE
jgi:hypothetical protein